MKICFDLDGVICSDEKGEYAKCVPDYGIIHLINKYYNEGHTIVIQTARHHEWEQYTQLQLDLWQVEYHTLSVGAKIPADVYIDDKAINVKDWEG